MTGLAALPRNWQKRIVLDDRTFEGTPCWNWTGAHTTQGYGSVGIGGKTALLHRVAWELIVGPIPDGLQIDHRCRNKQCCRPEHLEPVSCKENANRRPDVNKTHCINGHEMTEDNTAVRIQRQGWISRNCKACQRERNRNRYNRPAA